MNNFFRILFGRVCCPRDDGKPEWTLWERKEATFSRPVDGRDGVYYVIGVKDRVYTQIYQERQCVTCGKIQQKTLKY
jgi:hypothetical protein